MLKSQCFVTFNALVFNVLKIAIFNQTAKNPVGEICKKTKQGQTGSLSNCQNYPVGFSRAGRKNHGAQ